MPFFILHAVSAVASAPLIFLLEHIGTCLDTNDSITIETFNCNS